MEVLHQTHNTNDAFKAEDAERVIKQVDNFTVAGRQDGSLSNVDLQYSLPAFTHFIATLVTLRQAYHVSLDSLRSYHGLKLGHAKAELTFWVEPPFSSDVVWEKMDRVKNGVKYGVFGAGEVTSPRLVMEAAHFFAAGENLAQSVFRPVWEKYAPVALGVVPTTSLSYEDKMPLNNLTVTANPSVELGE